MNNTNPYKQVIGQQGEKLAAEFLKQKGIDVLEFNFYTRYGEIDIIAKDKDEYVFVEVKTRRSKKHGEPQESITKFKQRNLIRTAQVYLQKYNLEEIDWRIDVVAIYLHGNKEPEINYIESAVTFF